MIRSSRIPSGVVFEGRVRGQGDLHVAGEIVGPVEIDGQLVIESGGAVRGDVRARAVLVSGVLEGHAMALELVRLEPGARMVGDARAERVSAAAGSQLRGRIRTSQERALADRMRRTAGGTLLAPFSSSGTIPAPVMDARDVAPRDVAPREQPLPPPQARETAWERDADATPSNANAERETAQLRPSRVPPEPPPSDRETAQLRPSRMPVAAGPSVPVEGMPSASSTSIDVPAENVGLADDGMPRIPSIGRRRARRRTES